MRFITYRTAEGEGVGIAADGGYRGRPVQVLGRDLKGALHDGQALAALGRELAGAPLLDMDDIELLAPIPRPDKIICVGLNYADHSAESGFEVPTYPTVFARFASSLVGHGAAMVRPAASDLFDYEGELVAVIGKGGRHIGRAQALDHVAGYSLFNDGSVRDFQIRTPQWTMGKAFDGTGAFGPELVTPDELPEGCKGLTLTVRLNGEVMQCASTDDLIFGIADLVATLSEAMTLAPGDVIVTGTPGGVGAMRKPPVWLKPGDICTVEMDRIGTLSNPVRQEAVPV
ncbi:fumarylacetoacetate hydrolase family protein [Niveispirillum fermenti]|uniref:fumarylacetoacetate hydrolase family protein n=1 Tax=Niveispirillum fermenti TaxID=1233113 RepID=UPI003A89653E